MNRYARLLQNKLLTYLNLKYIPRNLEVIQKFNNNNEYQYQIQFIPEGKSSWGWLSNIQNM